MRKTEMLKSPCYKLGRTAFSVECCDAEFLRVLDKLFVREQSDLPADEVIEVRAGCNQDIYALMRHIRRLHSDCIWIDAACLVSAEGFKVLIAGGSSAGKSTTSLALALGHGWKVLAEDVTLFDLSSNQILSFPTPFSLKGKTRALLKKTIGRQPEESLLREWVPMGDMAAIDHHDCRLNLTIFLNNVASSDLDFESVRISPYEFIRLIVSRSSVLRIKGASDRMLEYFDHGPCWTINGGTLAERLEFILSNSALSVS
jgi:hypothetical protein